MIKIPAPPLPIIDKTTYRLPANQYVGEQVPKSGIVLHHTVSRCLVGETKIPLLDGSCPTIEELVGRRGDFWVYSVDESGYVVPGRASNARVTDIVDEVLEIQLDDGSSFRCTPEHRLLLRTGEYKAASEILIGESLMPMYFTHDAKGYQQVKAGTGKKILTHKLVAPLNLENEGFHLPPGEKYKVVHHKDFNILNNEPSNLLYMGTGAHKKHHCDLGGASMKKNWKNPTFVAKMRERCKKKTAEAPARRQAKYDLHASFVETPELLDDLWQTRGRCSSKGYLFGNHWEDPKFRARVNGILAEYYLERRKKRCKKVGKKDNKCVDCATDISLYATRCSTCQTAYMLKTTPEVFANRKGSTISEAQKQRISESSLANWKDEEYLALMAARSRKCSTLCKDVNIQRIKSVGKILKQYRKLCDKFDSVSAEIWDANMPRPTRGIPGSATLLDKYFSSWEDLHKQAYDNHKIESIRRIKLSNPIQVYDIEVEQYHNFALECGIVVHNSVDSVFDWWVEKNGRKVQRVGTAYVIGTDGTIYEFFPDDCWAWHLGKGNGTANERRTIGIEIVSEGPLRKDADGNYYTVLGNHLVEEASTVSDLGVTWRGFRYFDAYDIPQFWATVKLVYDLCDRFNIPRKIQGDLWNFAESTKTFEGIYTHAQVRRVKTDLHPHFPILDLAKWAHLEIV